MYEIQVEKLKDLRFTSSDYRYMRFQNLKDKLPMQKIALKAELKYINKLIKWTKI